MSSDFLGWLGKIPEFPFYVFGGFPITSPFNTIPFLISLQHPMFPARLNSQAIKITLG